MAASMGSNSKLESEDIKTLINGLCVADCMKLITDEVLTTEKEDPTNNQLKELTVSDVLACSYCNVTFVDAMEQRSHFKLDWHRYNLKQALLDLQPVLEEVFDNLADDVSSISGSDSENSRDSDTETSEAVNPAEVQIIHPKAITRHAKVFFENEEGQLISLYRCLLHGKKETPSQEQLISTACSLIKNFQKWLIVMLGGGHFAAAIFEDSTPISHKTFHCYTVRAKQGGGQSSRDNRGSGHSKSAGASLRRYNELALVQHVQEIMTTWVDQIKQCELILYRAAGPFNRGALFGGKKAPLDKADPRLRTIPFPTRRPTFSEVKRVRDMLATVENHGPASEFKDTFPRSPDRRQWSPRKVNIDSKEKLESFLESQLQEHMEIVKEKHSPRKFDRCKERSSPEREIPGQDLQSSSESSSESGDDNMYSNDLTISFDHLQEYADTVPRSMKEAHRAEAQRKKRRKLTRKQKNKLERKKSSEMLEEIRKKLIASCKLGDKELLLETLKVSESLPHRTVDEGGEQTESGGKPTQEDFVECLNSAVSEDTMDTLLHLASAKCFPDIVTVLLSAGADPTLKNKHRLTPYVAAGDKDTRNSFRAFVASYPDKFDFRKANIPEPLTEEQEKELEEKKKEKKKQKRVRDKIKKKENQEKKEEEKERENFLALSDREKCALAAERRLVSASTANLKKAQAPVLSRCFQCAVDITGKVPFEYMNNRFCTVVCLKAHRSKTNSYGMEI